MSDTSLILGPVVFRNFEIPERINFGGQQQLTVHKLIGGGRVVDAMGADPSDRTWSGRFQGRDATMRARLLDSLCAAGASLPLTWGGFFYLVVIRSFEAQYERFYQILYKISVTVVSDPAGQIAGSVYGGLEALVGGDLTDAVSLVGLTGSSQLGGAVTALSAAIGAVGNLNTASAADQLPCATAALNAVNVGENHSRYLDSSISSAAIPAGTSPAVMAANIALLQSAIPAQIATRSVIASASRIGANLSVG